MSLIIITHIIPLSLPPSIHCLSRLLITSRPFDHSSAYFINIIHASSPSNSFPPNELLDRVARPLSFLVAGFWPFHLPSCPSSSLFPPATRAPMRRHPPKRKKGSYYSSFFLCFEPEQILYSFLCACTIFPLLYDIRQLLYSNASYSIHFNYYLHFLSSTGFSIDQLFFFILSTGVQRTKGNDCDIHFIS